MTKKLCTYSGCKTVVDHNDDGSSPRCTEHQNSRKQLSQKERQRKYEHHFDENGKNIYSTWKWKKLRAKKVELNPICEHCEKRGIAKPVEEVDHIIEIQDGGAVWDINNLQSLCKRHHKIKTEQAKKERNRKRDEWGYLL